VLVLSLGQGSVWEHSTNHVSKNFNVFCLLKTNFFMFFNRFNVLMSKIILKNKKNYFDVFQSKKHFEHPPLL
jgi:hypothetical protein